MKVKMTAMILKIPGLAKYLTYQTQVIIAKIDDRISALADIDDTAPEYAGCVRKNKEAIMAEAGHDKNRLNSQYKEMAARI